MTNIILTDYEESDYELELDSIDANEYPELDEEM